MIAEIFFYILSLLLLVFAFKTVTTKLVLHAAIYLIATLMSLAALFILLNAEFLAAVQLLVYVGGILVVTVYSILLVSRVGETVIQFDKRWILMATGVVGVILVGLIYLQMVGLNITNHSLVILSENDTARQIGGAILSLTKEGFILPFELISLVLLSALIGAVLIAKEVRRPGANTENEGGE